MSQDISPETSTDRQGLQFLAAAPTSRELIDGLIATVMTLSAQNQSLIKRLDSVDEKVENLSKSIANLTSKIVKKKIVQQSETVSWKHFDISDYSREFPVNLVVEPDSAQLRCIYLGQLVYAAVDWPGSSNGRFQDRMRQACKKLAQLVVPKGIKTVYLRSVEVSQEDHTAHIFLESRFVTNIVDALASFITQRERPLAAVAQIKTMLRGMIIAAFRELRRSGPRQLFGMTTEEFLHDLAVFKARRPELFPSNQEPGLVELQFAKDPEIPISMAFPIIPKEETSYE